MVLPLSEPRAHTLQEQPRPIQLAPVCSPTVTPKCDPEVQKPHGDGAQGHGRCLHQFSINLSQLCK